MHTPRFPQSATTAESFSTFCGVSSLLLGSIVIYGWHSHNVLLVQISPTFAPMQFNTALGFLASGLALLLVTRGRNGAGAVCSLFLGLIGLLTLFEYVVGS